MLEEYRELIDLLAQTPTKLKEAAAQAGDPPDGEWNAAQVIGHLAAVEYFFLDWINRMTRENEPYFSSFGEEAQARQETMMDNDVATNLAAFNELRGETVSNLMSLALNMWERIGHHPGGSVSVESLVESMIDHDADHIQQIEALATS